MQDFLTTVQRGRARAATSTSSSFQLELLAAYKPQPELMPLHVPIIPEVLKCLENRPRFDMADSTDGILEGAV